MKTFDYFSDYVKVSLSLPFRDHDIRFAIQEVASKTILEQNDISFDDSTNISFTLPSFPVKDASIVFYRGTDLTNIRDAGNILTYEEFDSQLGAVTPTQAFAIDFAFGEIILKEAFDLDIEYCVIAYKDVNKDSFTDTILEILSISDPITKEQRMNVDIEKKAYSDILKTRRQVAATAGLGEIQEITLTRLSHGIEYGVDSQGEPLP